jgi:hypothetical protein
MQIHMLVMVAAAVAVVAIGCFKLGAEFCPPTVVIAPREATTIVVDPKLLRDAGGEQ